MLDVTLHHSFPGFTLDARFTAGPGLTALFGQSGGGKTTLVNALAGLLKPQSGRIVLGGQVLFDAEAGLFLPPERRRIGYVFQDARLFPHLSVRSNLLYGKHRNPVSNRPEMTLEPVCDLLGIGPLLDRRPHRLSGGERQRVALGRALLSNPRLLLMDEPLAALDEARKAEILPFIERLKAELDLPIVYVSHSTDEIIRLADTVVMIRDGKVVATGGVEDLSRRPELGFIADPAEAGAVIAMTVADHVAADGLTRLRLGDNALHVPRLDAPVGARMRVRIRARDVALALTPPHDVSVLNVFPGTVAELRGMDGTDAYVDVLVDAGPRLWARITRRAARNLNLRVGQSIHCMVKAVSIDGHAPAGALRGRDMTGL